MAAADTTPPTVLDDLAATAIDLPSGSAVLCEGSGRRHILKPAAHIFGALVGLRCPFKVGAVGAVADGKVWHRGCSIPVKTSWVLNRLGQTAGRLRIDGDTFPMVEVMDCPSTDLSRRALQMATPACSEPVVALTDGVFFRRAAEAIDRHPPPRLDWAELAALHPLSEGRSLTATELLERRAAFERAHTWSSLRRSASQQGRSAPLLAPGLTTAVAGWLDDGSFARWVLAGLGNIKAIRAAVTEELSTGAASRLSRAMTAPEPAQSPLPRPLSGSAAQVAP